MCFVWISEQTAIISLYNINWLVCIKETESVYCAVRTGSLYIIQVNLSPTPFLLQFSMFTFSAACLYWNGERANFQVSKFLYAVINIASFISPLNLLLLVHYLHLLLLLLLFLLLLVLLLLLLLLFSLF
jgi:hypothetical protein